MIIKKIILFIIIAISFSKDHIAVIDFKAIGVQKSDAKAITQRITTELIKVDEYVVLERSQIRRILKEQKFQSSGACSDISCAVDVGKIVGARYVVLGTVSKIGRNTYALDARLVDVESSESIRSGDYTTNTAIDNLLLQGARSVVKQIIGHHDDVQDVPSSVEEEDVVWKTDDYISYFRTGFDLEGSSSTYEAQGLFYEPSTGFTLGYEYAQPNGFGIGVEFQFYRELVSDYTTKDFGYDSIYIIWNSTFSNGFSLFSKGGYSRIKIDELSTENYNNGLYIGAGIRRPISTSMHMELGFIVNAIDEENLDTTIEHQYSRFYVGLSFIF